LKTANLLEISNDESYFQQINTIQIQIDQIENQMTDSVHKKSIFGMEQYISPFVHLMDKDKYSVHKMGNVYHRYND